MKLAVLFGGISSEHDISCLSAASILRNLNKDKYEIYPVGIVLAVVERESTYGYRITQDVQKVLDISESTLYPVLRRLMKDGCLTTYDQAYAGRNRRYYQITEHGRAALRQHRIDWQNYRSGIDTIFFGGVNE